MFFFRQRGRQFEPSRVCRAFDCILPFFFFFLQLISSLFDGGFDCILKYQRRVLSSMVEHLDSLVRICQGPFLIVIVPVRPFGPSLIEQKELPFSLIP